MTVLATERLILGPFEPTDLDALHRWENDAEILAMSDDDLGGQTVEQTKAMLARWMAPSDEAVRFAIRVAETRRFIGFINLGQIERAQGRCRTGFCIGEKDAWGRGYGTEALRAVVAHAFETLGLRRVGAEAYADNPRSIALLSRVGFRREGVKRDYVARGDGFVDELDFGLLRDDWIAARRAQ
jgi:RimJ/RimL family protein N-acetyltransferase